MITTAIALIVVVGFAFYVMTREERARFVNAAVALVAPVIGALRDSPAGEEFNTFLRARTRHTVVTPFLIALNTAIFVFMVWSDGALGDAQTLIGWGANFAPHTTNGEWWRLVSAMFVHGGVLQFVIAMAAL